MHPSTYKKLGTKVRHGMAYTDIYKLWTNIIQRCYNDKNPYFKNYGARGIKVCRKWHSFTGFNKSFGKLRIGKQQINRINNDKGYSPDNCEWVSHRQNQRNKRTVPKLSYNGKSQSLPEWCEELNLPYDRTYSRLRTGYSIAEAFQSEYKKWRPERPGLSKLPSKSSHRIRRTVTSIRLSK